jgi:hypothetical protein
MPATMWKGVTAGNWALQVHGVEGSLCLVTTDDQAKHRAAQLLSQALGRAVSPTDVRLVYREDPDITLAGQAG